MVSSFVVYRTSQIQLQINFDLSSLKTRESCHSCDHFNNLIVFIRIQGQTNYEFLCLVFVFVAVAYVVVVYAYNLFNFFVCRFSFIYLFWFSFFSLHIVDVLKESESRHIENDTKVSVGWTYGTRFMLITGFDRNGQ